MPKQNNRKNEHVSLSEKFYAEKTSPFKEVSFVHHSLPQMDVKDVDLSVQLDTLHFDVPFFINAMTGGSPWTGKINEKLAIIAREANLAMATGSVSAALKDPSQEETFKIVRDVNPNGTIIANLGAGHGLENAKKVVDLLKADALQIHVNAPQEIVMPEGDREFSNWLFNIQEIVEGLSIPVIVKEVGFGMSRETIQLLQSVGARIIDISGKGGTNFAQIENYRRKDFKLDDLEDWGQSTPISLLEANEVKQNANIIASGGLRKPIDIVKALALGADLTGLSSQFMHMALKDAYAAIEAAEQWKVELAHTMTLLRSKTIQDLHQTDLILTGDIANWCMARDIDIKKYAFRS
jgi:isopentenyl-diphosphate delta-isomerase